MKSAVHMVAKDVSVFIIHQSEWCYQWLLRDKRNWKFSVVRVMRYVSAASYFTCVVCCYAGISHITTVHCLLSLLSLIVLVKVKTCLH